MSEEEETRLFSKRHSEYGTYEAETKKNEDSYKQKKFPKSSFFILANEFCERFSFYGMRAILTLYLRNVLHFSEDSSTMIYHGFIMVSYITPLFGAMIADSLLGKFRTIFYLSTVYAFGNLILSAAATPPLSLPPIPFSMVGLSLIALGTGGIKPCVVAFGGDQFQIPEQESQLQKFFSIFYFFINCGSLLSTFLTPIFRKDISCFGNSTCYSLAFSVPAALMIASIFIFLLGQSLYVIKKPEGNLFTQVAKCIGHAISKKWGKGSTDSQNHWLDFANDEYGTEFIEDIKMLLRIAVLYIPIPVFWSLLDQQGSRWTLQATRMDGRLFGWTIKPDQMQVVNSFLVLLFIPLFEKIIYPVFARCNLLKESLHRIALGGFLMVVSFVIAGGVKLQLEPSYPVIPGISQSRVNFVNTLPCTVNITLRSPSNYTYGPDTIQLQPFENFFYESIEVNNCTVEVSSSINNDRGCYVNGKEVNFHKIQFVPESAQAYSVLLAIQTEMDVETETQSLQLIYSNVGDHLEKSLEGNSKLRIIVTDVVLFENATFRLKAQNMVYDIGLDANDVASSTLEILPDNYIVWLLLDDTDNSTDGNPIELGSVSFETGGSYLLSVATNYTAITSNESLTMLELNASIVDYMEMSVYILTKPNQIHMLWLLPQFIMVTLGEVLFSISGYKFSYTKAPSSMKAVIQSLWFLTDGLGNLLVIIITELKIFERQSMESFVFAGLGLAATFIFVLLARNFKANDIHEEFLK